MPPALTSSPTCLYSVYADDATRAIDVWVANAGTPAQRESAAAAIGAVRLGKRVDAVVARYRKTVYGRGG